MKLRVLFLVFLSSFFITGCTDVFDCITNKRPQIHNATFPRGQEGVYYYAEVTTEIKNEPRDNDYGYYYRLYGELPVGIRMFDNYRTVSFEGVPEESGVFTFTLELTVDPPVNIDGFQEVMCERRTSKNFTIVIDE